MATSKAAPKADPNASEGAPQKSKKKLMMIVIIVVLAVLVGGGAGGWYVWTSKNAHSEPAKKKAEPPVFAPLEMFTVNLQPDSGEHYLQIGITLQLGSKEEVDLVKLHMPQIRSRLLMLLSSKKAGDIATTEGKNVLVKEIVEQVNMPFSPNGAPQTVSNVFFTSFVIQ